MPTKTEVNNERQITTLRSRVSELTDRIVILENELKTTRKLVQQDMRKILNVVEGR
jgi:uncharacterized protein involved in exopolysaccharide biosynthesis